MSSYSSAPSIQLRNVLLPWRLFPTIVDVENDQTASERSIICLVLLVALFVDLALISSLTLGFMFSLLIVFAATYCAILLTISFIVLNVDCRQG